MPVQLKHLVHQTKTLATLGDVALIGLKQQLGLADAAKGQLTAPGPIFTAEVPPRPAQLLRDYVRHVGGSTSAYRETVPAHLLPQWLFPIASKTVKDAPYPLVKMVNGGCRLEMKGPLPADLPLQVSARLDDVDDNGRRVVIRQRATTGTADEPELVVAYVSVVIPLSTGDTSDKSTNKQKKKDKKAKKNDNGLKKAKKKWKVPEGAREIGYWRLGADAGLAYAALTGDFNPVHWLRPYARAFGFRSTILHGFATMARAIEGLNRSLFSGDVSKLTLFDGRFTKPLVLPARVGLYIDGDRAFVGDAPGGPAYLTATFATKDRTP